MTNAVTIQNTEQNHLWSESLDAPKSLEEWEHHCPCRSALHSAVEPPHVSDLTVREREVLLLLRSGLP